MASAGNNLLIGTGLNGVVTPNWFALPNTSESPHQITFNFSLIAGTATYFLEGRNSPSDAAIQLDTGSASKKLLVERMNQMRCRLSASAGAQVVASIPTVQVDAGP